MQALGRGRAASDACKTESPETGRRALSGQLADPLDTVHKTPKPPYRGRRLPFKAAGAERRANGCGALCPAWWPPPLKHKADEVCMSAKRSTTVWLGMQWPMPQ